MDEITEVKPKLPEDGPYQAFEPVLLRIFIKFRGDEQHDAASKFVREISAPLTDENEDKFKDKWCGCINGILFSRTHLALDFVISEPEAKRPLHDLLRSIGNELGTYGLPGPEDWDIG